MLYFTLKIADIHQETEDTITISFKQPGLKKIKYLAGQYLTLIFRINNRRYSRAYSFSSAPEIDTTLNITVKRVPGGIVSNHIADCLSVGDVVEVMEPMGNFTLEKVDSSNRIVLWAAGSGITPLISIVKYALQKQVVKHVTLVYGNRDQERTIFNEQILELQKKYANIFSVWHFHTQAVVTTDNPNVIQGRIDPNKVLKVLSGENDLVHTVHYICGPAGLKESVSLVLNQNNISKENIFVEEFNLTADPKKFDGIITRNITINKTSIAHQVEVTKGKTILEASLDASVDLPYSCQTGSCLICKGKLVRGELRSIADYERSALNANEYLLCCSIPATDNIEICID